MRENYTAGPRSSKDQCRKTILRGTIDAGKNCIVFVGLNSGPGMENDECGKTMNAGTIDWGSTVFEYSSNDLIFEFDIRIREICYSTHLYFY